MRTGGGILRLRPFDASNKVTATVPVGQRPWNMAVTPDGRKLYVANGRSDSVSVIDTATRKETSRVKLKGINVRGLATSFPVVTGPQDPWSATATDWEAVARVGGTIVVLMGVAQDGACGTGTGAQGD